MRTKSMTGEVSHSNKCGSLVSEVKISSGSLLNETLES